MESYYPDTNSIITFMGDLAFDENARSGVNVNPRWHDPTNSVLGFVEDEIRLLPSRSRPRNATVRPNRRHGHKPDPRVLMNRARDNIRRVRYDPTYDDEADRAADLNMYEGELRTWRSIHEIYTDYAGNEEYSMDEIDMVLHMMNLN